MTDDDLAQALEDAGLILFEAAIRLGNEHRYQEAHSFQSIANTASLICAALRIRQSPTGISAYDAARILVATYKETDGSHPIPPHPEGSA